MASPVERNPFSGHGGNGTIQGNLPNITEEEEVVIEIELPEDVEQLLLPLEEEVYNHWDNLVVTLDADDLLEIANNVIEEYEADKESRSEWESTFERGFDLLGLKLEEASQPFDGACTAVHPLIIESAVKFQSKASQEIFPSKGPVRTQIMGASTPDKEKQANRVMNFMNYQLTEQMPEYFDETERMLFNLPIFGSAFKKIYYDLTLERPVAEFVPIDNFYVSYNASDLKNADHYTQVIYRTPNDLRKDIMSEMYALPEEDEMLEPSEVTPSTLRQKMDNILGIQPDYTQNPQHTLLEHHCYLNIEHPNDEDDGYEKTTMDDKDNFCVGLPYVVTVDLDSKSVLSIRRNWNENDPLKEKLLWFTHYRFVPGFGFYGLGYIHFLGNLTATSTAAMRNLVDAGQFATLPGGFKARGVRVTGGDEPIAPGEFREVEATGIDLNKAIINLPYKEPSQTLLAMLQFVTAAGQKFADETDQVVSDASNYGPVGTTVALIEQSMKFFTGIHKRIHHGQRQELAILSRINYDFLPDEYPYDIPLVSGQIFKQDFDGRVDIIPVTDPNIPSQAHRLAKAQMILQLSSQAPPGVYNFKEVNSVILDSLNIDHPERFIVPDQQPQPLDPVSDIQQATNGMPIKAFPGQDHKAHIVVKTSFIEDPTLGQTPIMAKVVPLLQANIREHMILQYEEQMGGMLKMGTQQAGTGSPEAISTITQGAAQEILQNNKRMAEMGTTEDLERQTLELQKQQLTLEEAKTRIDAAETAANVALDKEKMQLEYAELEMNMKKLQVEASEKLAKIQKDDTHKTLDREDNFLIEILKILVKESGISSERLIQEARLTPDEVSKFAEGGLTPSEEIIKEYPTGFTEQIGAMSRTAPEVWKESARELPDLEAITTEFDAALQEEPAPVSEDLPQDVSPPDDVEVEVEAALTVDKPNYSMEELTEAISETDESLAEIETPEPEIAETETQDSDFILASLKQKNAKSVDIGLYQITNGWLKDPDAKGSWTSFDPNRPGIHADKAMPLIDEELKKLNTSMEEILNIPEEERLRLLRDDVTINRAYAKGIYDAWGLKRWAPATRKKILEDLKKENSHLKPKEVRELMKNMTFEEMSPYIIKYESGDNPNALGYNMA